MDFPPLAFGECPRPAGGGILFPYLSLKVCLGGKRQSLEHGNFPASTAPFDASIPLYWEAGRKSVASGELCFSSKSGKLI